MSPTPEPPFPPHLLERIETGRKTIATQEKEQEDE